MDADLILSDERVDDHGRPVPTPPTSEDQCDHCGRILPCTGICAHCETPTPALTDEQMDGGFDGDGIRLMHESLIRIWAERYGETRAVSDWYAAVTARAKREERERIGQAVRALHTPVSLVFSWNAGLREYPPCPTCNGRAGVHECGCWADEDLDYECRECTGREGKRRVVTWPCPTILALEGADHV